MKNPTSSEDPETPRFCVFVQGDELLLVTQAIEKLTLEEAQKRSTELSMAIVRAVLNRFHLGEK